MQETHRQKIRNVWNSRFQLISRRGDSVESHARFGHRLHFRAKPRTRSRSERCFGAGDLRRQYFSHLRGGAWAFGNSGYIGTRFQRYQIAGQRVFGFSRTQNAARSPQAFEFAVPFPVAHNGGGISPGRLDQYSESESGTVFSRVPSPVHRPDVEQQNRSVSRIGSYIRHDRNNLVPYLSVVRLVLERALARCLSFLGCVSPRRSDDLDFARRRPAIPSISFLRVKQSSSRDSAPDRFETASMTFRNRDGSFATSSVALLKFSSECRSWRDAATILPSLK
jgi:hypothetical protein